MRFLAIILAVLSLTACGKRPGTLEIPENATYPRAYPPYETSGQPTGR
jgi:predicted small lipoprotein YifL